jgi:hypothetical protein
MHNGEKTKIILQFPVSLRRSMGGSTNLIQTTCELGGESAVDSRHGLSGSNIEVLLCFTKRSFRQREEYSDTGNIRRNQNFTLLLLSIPSKLAGIAQSV